jgi:hypothetical protein
MLAPPDPAVLVIQLVLNMISTTFLDESPVLSSVTTLRESISMLILVGFHHQVV